MAHARLRSFSLTLSPPDEEGVELLVFPECFLQGYLADDMMRRDAAERWKDRHHAIRVERARETGMWLASADVTGKRDESHVAYGPTSIINPHGEVQVEVSRGTTGMAIADIC